MYCMFESTVEPVYNVCVNGSKATTVGVGGVVYSLGTTVV